MADGCLLIEKDGSRVGTVFFSRRTRRDSNPQPADSKSDALSIELRVQVLKLLYTRCIFRQFQARFFNFLKVRINPTGQEALKNPVFGAILVQPGAIKAISVGFFGATG
jgi:hypothetical protein